jgi:predicted TIM-barrel fold metal-dependent hydrolase
VWDGPLLPPEALQRNFWFCTIDDPSTMELRARIGIDHIMLESDYPHADSTWPDTQQVVARNVAGLSAEDAARITHRNAAQLFRHPLPDDGWLAGPAAV